MPSPTFPSARVLANRAKRVQMHHDALDGIVRGYADRLAEFGPAIIADAASAPLRDPEKAAERGVAMMLDTGSWQVWALGKRAAGTWQAKPRMNIPKDQAVLIVLFSSPLAHLHEFGTVDMPAHPFLSPAFNRAMAGLAPALNVASGRKARLNPVGQLVAGAMGYTVGAHGGVQRAPRATR